MVILPATTMNALTKSCSNLNVVSWKNKATRTKCSPSTTIIFHRKCLRSYYSTHQTDLGYKIQTRREEQSRSIPSLQTNLQPKPLRARRVYLIELLDGQRVPLMRHRLQNLAELLHLRTTLFDAAIARKFKSMSVWVSVCLRHVRSPPDNLSSNHFNKHKN